MFSTIQIIPKEQVGNFPFSGSEVFNNYNDQLSRMYNLQKARSLGNLFQHKVNIEYELNTGEKHCVYTTVWSVCPEFVILKGGKHIPVKAISKVKLL